ncbi:hypothetical protein LOZ54_006196 [Ophidiomyces ophidiicola]|nr:hypothetical protein LOZ54_006196 [Ophidiomyces ophidiicola]
MSLLFACTLGSLLLFSLLYAIGGVIHRLYFSPLSKFPGPKLAAATLWYEFYYDVVLKGQYTFKIKSLHQKYGPIVRISPYELHISDPEFYGTLYSHSSPRDKCAYYVKPFDFPQSSFGTIDARLHRLRRGAINPFFSRGKVLKQESLIQELVLKFCKRVENFGKPGAVIPLSLGFTCLITDLITSYVMGRSYHYIDQPDWHPHWGQTLRDASEFGMLARQVTWVLPILKSIPQVWAEALNPGLCLFFTLTRRTQDRISETQKERDSMEKGELRFEKKQTLIDQVLDSKLAAEEKSSERLAQEIRSAIGAGTETTSNALTVTMFHVFSNPETLRRLQRELQELEPDLDAVTNLCDLEKLPYLSSCILEGLRLSYGVSTRLQRKSNTAIQYKEFSIPPGTAVGMTSVLQHHDEHIFPNSHDFLPERWLDPVERKRLDKYLVTFSKGSRRCIGMNLAQAAMYTTVAELVRRFDMELHGTTRDDIDVKHDLFIPRPKNLKTLGLQVKLKR